MTEANRRPATGDLSNVPPTPARLPAPQMRPTNDIAPDPLEIANRALEGLSPATESWFNTPRTNPTPRQTRPHHTPYEPQPHPAVVPRHPDARSFQPPRPVHQRPMPSHAQLPQYAYQPSPYTAQQLHPAGPVMFANPAMPPYAAAQVPTRGGSSDERRPAPANRSRNKKTVLLPLAAMAIASAGIGAFAQANVDEGLETQTQQVKAQADLYTAVPVIDETSDQQVISAPGVIAPEETSLFSDTGRITAGGKHSNGDYDAPSRADELGGSHASSGTISTPRDGEPLSDHEPAPAPEPEPEPEPTPEPDPAPEPEEPTPGPTPPTPPSLGENVVTPVLDTVTGVIDGLTGIRLDLTR